MRAGARNLITDVAGLRVGNAADGRLKSGVTVLTADAPFAAAVHVMGGAPGTRETDLLAPDKLVAAADALVLAGGSAFGLDACGGVAAGLLTSTAQLGTALGLAVTTPVVAAAAPMTGYRLGFGVAALIGVAGLLAARAVPRSSRRPSRPVDAVTP